MARDLKLFYWFRLLATSYLWFPVFFLFKVARGLEQHEVWLLAGVYSATVIVIEIPTGAFADRIGRRTSMAVGALAMVASCLVAYFAYSMPVFIVAEVLAAASISLCSGADSAYLFDLLHAADRSEEYARREGHASGLHLVGSVVAIAAGGALGAIDLGLPFLVNAGVAGVAFVIALAMSDDAPVAPKRAGTEPAAAHLRSYLTLMGGAVRKVLSDRGLWWIIGFSAVAFMLLRATDYIYQPYLRSQGFGIASTGLVLAGVYLVAAMVAFNVDRLRRATSESFLLWGMLVALAASFALLHQLSGAFALAVLGVQAMVIGLYSPLIKPIINRQIVDSSRRATILSIESIARRAAAGVFIPIIGLYGESTASQLCGAAALVGFFVLLFLAPRGARVEAATILGQPPIAAAQVVAEREASGPARR